MVGSSGFLALVAVCVFLVQKNLVFEAVYIRVFTKKTIVSVDLYDISINYALYM